MLDLLLINVIKSRKNWGTFINSPGRIYEGLAIFFIYVFNS
jgi:hypothetical protein